MSIIGRSICKNNIEIGVIEKENNKTFTYGPRKYVKKIDFDKSWKLCQRKIIKKCNDNKYINKSSKGKLAIRVRKGIYSMSMLCFPETFGSNFPKSDFINLSFFSDPLLYHFWLEDGQKEIITYFFFNISTNTIWNICTNDKFRKQNCFNTLFKFFLDKIDPSIIYLFVLKTNLIAQKIYIKLGFSIIGENETSYHMMFYR